MKTLMLPNQDQYLRDEIGGESKAEFKGSRWLVKDNREIETR